MLKIFEMYTGEILLAIVALVFILGNIICNQITNAQNKMIIMSCIESGKQVIEGDCVE